MNAPKKPAAKKAPAKKPAAPKAAPAPKEPEPKPEVKPEGVEVETDFSIKTEHFEVASNRVRARQVVDLKLVGWVGTGLLFEADDLDELIGVLQDLAKQLP